MRIVPWVQLRNRLLTSSSPLRLTTFAVVKGRLLESKIQGCSRLLDGRTRFQLAHDSQPPISRAHELRTLAVDLRLPPQRNRYIHRTAQVHGALQIRRRYAG